MPGWQKKKKISHGFLPLRYDTLFCILEKQFKKFLYNWFCMFQLLWVLRLTVHPKTSQLH